ncbi:MAG: hypothetical protein IJG63_04915 [Oscillospiraceae bacterium]|nr:hypothetical protein [Oscillospiraceae bacterium]
MTIAELAVQYRENAYSLFERAKELKRLALNRGLCETEQLRLRMRAELLMSMYRECSETAHYLENYYRRGK